MVDFLRYQRQMILSEIDREGQERLSRASVLVVGAGGLGCPIITYLSAAGVGHIRVADGDTVEMTNLHRQPLFTEADIGLRKAHCAVNRGNNPDVKMESLPYRVTADTIEESIRGVDLIIDGSDNFSTKYLLNDAAVHFNLPLVYGAVFGFEGQVSVFNALLQDGSRGPTYRCLYPHPPLAGAVPNCAEAGVLGVLPGIIGSFQALETLKILLGIGDLLSGRLLVFDGLTFDFSVVSFKRNSIAPNRSNWMQAEYASDVCVTLPIREVRSEEVKLMLQSGRKITLIDVREPSEKALLDIGGINIPSGRIIECTGQIPRDQTVVLYCRSGARSAACVDLLQREFGFENVVSLSGGVLLW